MAGGDGASGLVRRRRLSRHWWLIPLGVLVAALSLEWSENPDLAGTAATAAMRDRQADYYLEGFRTRKFDSDGALEYEVSGESLSHFANELRSEIIAPRVALFRPEVVWHVRSNSGELTENPDVFTFIDDVEIRRENEIEAPIVISTSTLDVHTGTNVVSTDAPVAVRATTWQLESTGLRSDLNRGTLILLDEVRGRYDVVAPGDDDG